MVSEGAGISFFRDVKFDTAGNVYAAGFYDGIIDLSIGPVNQNTVNRGGFDQGYFFHKFDSALNNTWSTSHCTRLGLPGNLGSRDNQVIIHPEGDQLYIGGGFEEKVFLQPDSLNGDTIGAPTKQFLFQKDIYFVRYNVPSGSFDIKFAPHHTGRHKIELKAMLVQPSQVVLSGTFNHPFIFDRYSGTSVGPSSYSADHVFIASFKKCAHAGDTIQNDSLVCGWYTHTDGKLYFAKDTIVKPDLLYSGSAGCDSLYAKSRIIVTSTFPEVIRNQNRLSFPGGFADVTKFKWYNCSGDSVLSNVINNSLTITAPGSYALIYTDGTCTDTSECFDFSDINLPEWEEEQSIQVYPNPAKDILYLKHSEYLEVQNISVISLDGQPLITSKKLDQVDIGTLPNGLYIIEVETKGHGLFRRKILKQ